jgi:uncharacterized protein YndB with AHSA1/START domain
MPDILVLSHGHISQHSKISGYTDLMEKIEKSIEINAPVGKVWNTMFEDATYREWTSEFHPGSHFRGDWGEGSKMLFIGPDEEGGEMGMVSRITENRPHEYVSIEHIGIYKNGVEDTESEDAKKWSPAYENYTFTEKDGVTEVRIDQDIEDEHKKMFEEMWDRALRRLKEIAEK